MDVITHASPRHRPHLVAAWSGAWIRASFLLRKWLPKLPVKGTGKWWLQCAQGALAAHLCFVLTHVLLVAVSFGNEITYNPVLSVNVQVDVHNVTIDFGCTSNTTDIAIEFCGTHGVRPDENCDVVLDAFLQNQILHKCQYTNEDASKHWYNQPVDYSRFFELLDEQNVYMPGNVKVVTLNADTNEAFEYTFSPVREDIKDPQGIQQLQIVQASPSFAIVCRMACQHMMQGIIQPECEYLLMAKSFWGMEEYSERMTVPMHAYEMKTPLHLQSNDVVDSMVTEPIHRYKKGAVARQLRSVGVSVVDDVLSQQDVQYLRNVVTNRPEFK